MLEEYNLNEAQGAASSLTKPSDYQCDDRGSCLVHIENKFMSIMDQQDEHHDAHDWFQSTIEHLRSHHPHSPLLLRIALCWCRLGGRQQQYESVIKSADIVLNHQSTSGSSCGRPQQLALAAAYKGFALMKKEAAPRCYTDALDCLEQAYTLFHQNPPKREQHHLIHTRNGVEESIIKICRYLGREPPLPPLIKFPRTAHLFRPQHSTAVTSDDQVLDKNHAMLRSMCDGKTVVTMEEKVDGANLGISLSLDGQRILVQNRSHYLCSGEHAQFGQLNPFIEAHRAELMKVLTGEDDTDDADDSQDAKPKSHRRRILYGEWLVARHSIPYGQLPNYFVAFDLYDIPSRKFVSRHKLHSILQETGIPVAPILRQRTFGPYKNTAAMESELLKLLTTTKSIFRTDGGWVEGFVFRIDDNGSGYLQERCKLVRPDFVAGCQEGHWAKRSIEKQIVDFEFGQEYLQQCYSLATTAATVPESKVLGLPLSVENPRQRVLVTYSNQDNNGSNVTLKTVIGNPKIADTRQVLLPRNLCWLWENEVAVASTPTCAEHIAAFQDTLNVGLVVTLTEEQPLPSEWFTPPLSTSSTESAKKKNGRTANTPCQNIFHPIPNGSPPTMQQMDHIGDDVVRAVAQGKAVLEHCGGGKGRAGSIAAALLLRFGRDGIRHRLDSENNSDSENGCSCRTLCHQPPFMTSDEAIQLIRKRRPGSLETVRQEEFVRQYAQHLWRLAAEQEAILSSSVTTNASSSNLLSKSASKPQSLPSYIVLTGIPGSGKSSIASRLTQAPSSGRRGSTFLHINQDELGSKACQHLVGRESARVANGHARGIVVDCCSVRESERRNWLKIMHQPPAHKTALIVVDTPVDVCIERVRSRVDHPTIPFGRGERIVRGFAKNAEHPTANDEKLFGRIEIVRSSQEVADLLQRWGITAEL